MYAVQINKNYVYKILHFLNHTTNIIRQHSEPKQLGAKQVY